MNLEEFQARYEELWRCFEYNWGTCKDSEWLKESIYNLCLENMGEL